MARIFTPLPRRVLPISSPPPLADAKVASMKALALVDVALLTQRIRQLRQHLAQHLALAPLLKAPMHRLVVRVALRKHVPLRAGVQNPQHRFEHFARRYRLATRATFGDVLLGKMLPNPFPLIVA